MFRKMRRSKQALSEAQAQEILRSGSSGVLALSGDGGWPYAVPMSYAFDEGRLYFHCAASGHKLDSVKREPRASFCVVAQDEVVPGEYTTLYRSAIAFGHVRIVEDEPEKRRAAELIGRKYAPDSRDEDLARTIDGEMGALCILELTIEHLSGKQSGKLASGK